jgi:hypothetical protein
LIASTDFLAGHAQLDVINAEVHMMADHLSHLIWSVCKGCDTCNQLAVPSSHLFAVCEISRSWNIASVDGISDDYIESIFC